MKEVVKELKQIRKILMNKNYEYTDGECMDEALEYIKQRLLQEIK